MIRKLLEQLHDIIVYVLILCGWGVFFLGILLFRGYLVPPYSQQTLNILAWPTLFDDSFIRDFEKQTGIKVNISYFEDNEQLFVKLKSTREQGYDLVMPADYGADLLRKAGLLKKIDTSRLHFIGQLYPQLRDHFFDPTNEFTIPFAWSIFGIGVDTRQFSGRIPPATWKLIFDPTVSPGRLGLPNDVRELIHIAAFYLFGTAHNLTTDQLWEVARLLKQQKPLVAMYTDVRADYLLTSQSSPLVVTLSAELGRAMQDYSYLDFIIPQEGTFMIIDTLAIPFTSTKDEQVYTFLNYLYQPSVMQKYVDKFGFSPAVKNIKIPDYLASRFVLNDAFIARMQFFRNDIPDDLLSEIWTFIKA